MYKLAYSIIIYNHTGTEQVTYVADSGQELFSHTYGSILQCCIAVDGISFAYIARREKDNKYLCHVFQALTYEEVSEVGNAPPTAQGTFRERHEKLACSGNFPLGGHACKQLHSSSFRVCVYTVLSSSFPPQAAVIMDKFKQHAKREVSVGSTVSRSATPPDDTKKSSGLIFAPPSQKTAAASKSLRGSGEDKLLCEYHLEYIGKFEVPSPSSSNVAQIETVDNIVAKLKENQKNSHGHLTVQSKGKPKKRSFTSMLKGIGKSSGKDSDSVDGIAASNSASSLLDDDDETTSPLAANEHSASSLSLHSQDGSSTDISITVTTASPDLLTPPMDVHRPMSQVDGDTKVTNGSERDGESSPSIPESRGQSPGDSGEGRQNGVEDNGTNGSVSGALDIVQNGKEDVDSGGGVRATSNSVSSEFDTLPELASLKDSLGFQVLSLTQNQRVKMVFSGLTVAMFSERGEEQLLNISIRNIPCCAQVSLAWHIHYQVFPVPSVRVTHAVKDNDMCYHV